MALSFPTSLRSKGHPFPCTAPLLSFPTHTLLICLAFSAFILYSIMAGCPRRLHQASYRHVPGLVYLVLFVHIITGSASSQHIGQGHLKDATAGVWQMCSGKNGGICLGQSLQTCKLTKKPDLNLWLRVTCNCYWWLSWKSVQHPKRWWTVCLQGWYQGLSQTCGCQWFHVFFRGVPSEKPQPLLAFRMILYLVTWDTSLSFPGVLSTHVLYYIKISSYVAKTSVWIRDTILLGPHTSTSQGLPICVVFVSGSVIYPGPLDMNPVACPHSSFLFVSSLSSVCHRETSSFPCSFSACKPPCLLHSPVYSWLDSNHCSTWVSHTDLLSTMFSE